MSAPEASFDARAEHFDRFAELVGRELDAYLLAMLFLPGQGGRRAVDLGCGTGRHAAILAGSYREVLAVDVSAPMLHKAISKRGLPNIHYSQRDLRSVGTAGDLRSIGGEDGTFDLVFSAFALHHVEDLDETLRGIRALVAPGGRALLIDNVDPRGKVSRRWLWKEAIRILAGDLIKRRRSSEQAWELFGLNTDPDWIDHLTSDRFLTPEQFTHRYSQVFPGARITDLYRARALCWTRPTSTPAGQARRERSAPTPPGEPQRRAGGPASVSAQPAAPHPNGRFATAIRRARLAAGLTQSQVAAGVGVQQSVICQWERGLAIPTVPTFGGLVAVCSPWPLLKALLPADCAPSQTSGPARQTRRHQHQTAGHHAKSLNASSSGRAAATTTSPPTTSSRSG